MAFVTVLRRSTWKSRLGNCWGRHVNPVRRVSVQITASEPSSIFRHDENLNAVRLLKSLPIYKNLLFRSEDGIEWSHLQLPGREPQLDLGAPDISKMRQVVVDFIETAVTSKEAKLPVTHPKNEVIIQNLLKDVSSLTDEELCQVLYHLKFFAPCPSVKDPAFMKVWKELDKECLDRRHGWSVDFCFVVADLWYGMNLARYSEFHWNLLKRLFRRCDKLSKEHFIRFLFCLNLNREIPENISSYELEYSLNKLCHKLSPEEIVVVGMAFFKTQTPIRDPDLLRKLLLTFMASSETVDSVSVSGISKLARYSSDYRSAQILYDFQEKFIPELPRLSITASTHLSLTGTNCLSPNKRLVQLVVDKILADVSEARLKELERISLSMTMFNADCDQLATVICNELQRPERADEIRKYGRCLPAILHYLSIRNVFNQDLMSMCLSKAFRDMYYGRGKEILQRELLCLDVVADIEIEDYSGKRLDEKSFSTIMKRNMLRLRPQKTKVSVYENFLRTFAAAMQNIFQDSSYFHVCGILPQHHTMAIVFCRDDSGNLVKVPQSFVDLETEDIKKIPKDTSVNFHAIILLGRNMYLYNSKELSGQANLQIRQIHKLGYTTHLVYSCDWDNSASMEQRINHINSIVSLKVSV